MVQLYYQSGDNIEFLTQTNIFYTVSQLNDTQLDSLHEALMTNISYDQIDISESLYSIVQSEDCLQHNFIIPRKKPIDDKNIIWLIIAIVSFLSVAGVFYYKLTQNIEQKKQPIKKEIIKKVKQKPIMLPNHISLNTKVVESILTMFDLIPYDGVLRELDIKKDSATIIANFIVKSESIKNLKKMLLSYYTDVKVMLEHNNKTNTLTSVIINAKGFKNSNNQISSKKVAYSKFKFTPVAKVIKYLKKIVPKESNIKLISKSSKGISTFSFSVISYIKTPKEFFDMVEIFNKNNVSIEIKYPIVFSKLATKIKVKYIINFNQKLKKIK